MRSTRSSGILSRQSSGSLSCQSGGRLGKFGALGALGGRPTANSCWDSDATMTLMMFCSSLLLMSKLASTFTLTMSPMLLSEIWVGLAVTAATSARTRTATNFIFPIELNCETNLIIFGCLFGSYTTQILSAPPARITAAFDKN